jgi:hypothetical protein
VGATVTSIREVAEPAQLGDVAIPQNQELAVKKSSSGSRRWIGTTWDTNSPLRSRTPETTAATTQPLMRLPGFTPLTEVSSMSTLGP